MACDHTNLHGVPLISIEGTTEECGYQLGCAWSEALARQCRVEPSELPWWKADRYAPLIDRYAPHLPGLFAGMAQGADLPEERLAVLGPAALTGGCTSFAVEPGMTLHGEPLSGQTKDTPVSRTFRYQVLRMRISDAPSMLTVT